MKPQDSYIYKNNWGSEAKNCTQQSIPTLNELVNQTLPYGDPGRQQSITDDWIDTLMHNFYQMFCTCDLPFGLMRGNSSQIYQANTNLMK
jgi:hypothetical protein